MILSSSIVAWRNFNYDSFNIFDIQSFVPSFIIGTETYFQVSMVWSFISEIWIFSLKHEMNIEYLEFPKILY